MPPVLNAAVGSPTANSYVTIAWADEYFDSRFPVPTIWLALSDDDKARALIRATDLIDVAVEWAGQVTYPDQALQWPRMGMRDARGIDVPPDKLPLNLLKAVCEQALILTAQNAAADNPLDSVTPAITSIAVDGISVGLDHSRIMTDPTTGSITNAIWDLLKWWGSIDSSGAKSGIGTIIRG